MRCVAFLAAVLLTVQLAFGQCPPGGCPAPQIQSWSPRGSAMGMIRPEQPRQRQSVQAPVSTTTPPEWLCHVYGASGMLIYKDADVGVVLTAYHVIQGGPRDGVTVRFPDGKSYTGRVYEDVAGNISADKLCDVAMVAIESPEAEPCVMARAKPPVGAPVWVLGYAAERRAKPTYLVRASRVAAYVRDTWREQQGPDGATLRADGWAEGGDSGGAMINAQGELAGVISTSDRSSTVSGPSLARIHALCANEEFDWPWLGWRNKAEERIEGLNRDKAERSELPIPPTPPVDDMYGEKMQRLEQKIDSIKRPPPSSDAAIGTLADMIDEDRGRLKALEEWVPLLGRIGDAEERLLKRDPDGLTELGKIVQADSKAAIDKANEATAALEKAVDGIAPAAKAAATEAVEKAVEDPSFLASLSKKFGIDGLVSNRLEAAGLEKTAGWVRWLWGLVIGTWVFYGFLVVVLGLIGWDVYAKLKHGHPLFIQTVTELAKKATPYIPTRIDDRLVNAADAGVDAVSDAAAAKVRGWFGIELQQAVAEGVKQGVAAAAKPARTKKT